MRLKEQVLKGSNLMLLEIWRNIIPFEAIQTTYNGFECKNTVNTVNNIVLPVVIFPNKKFLSITQTSRQ